MDQAEIRRHVSRLLDQCQDCPRWQNKPEGFHPDELCGGCTIYAKLREAGKQLGGDVERMPLIITKSEYLTLHNRGLIDREIAEIKQTSFGTLKAWKRAHGIRTPLRFPLTVEEYMNLRNEGKTDKEIAHEINRSRPAVEGWKRRNGIKTGQQKKMHMEEAIK